MKGIIIFKGKYGATGQYAEWLGKELGLPVFTPDNYRTEDIINCDFVIIGSSVYMGKLQLKIGSKAICQVCCQRKHIFLW